MRRSIIAGTVSFKTHTHTLLAHHYPSVCSCKGSLGPTTSVRPNNREILKWSTTWTLKAIIGYDSLLVRRYITWASWWKPVYSILHGRMKPLASWEIAESSCPWLNNSPLYSNCLRIGDLKGNIFFCSCPGIYPVCMCERYTIDCFFLCSSVVCVCLSPPFHRKKNPLKYCSHIWILDRGKVCCSVVEQMLCMPKVIPDISIVGISR